MTDATVPSPSASSITQVDARTKKRNAAEARFRLYGKIAVTIGVLSLIGLVASILMNGLSAFNQTFISLEIHLDESKLDKSGNRNLEEIKKVSTFGYSPLIKSAFEKLDEDGVISLEGMKSQDAAALISKEGAADLRRHVIANPDAIGTNVTFNFLASGRVDGFFQRPRDDGIRRARQQHLTRTARPCKSAQRRGASRNPFQLGFPDQRGRVGKPT